MTRICRDQARPFVLLFEGRSGSTYLIEALASHPAIYTEGEKLVRLKDKGADRQLQWVREFLARSSHRKYRAIGFKTKFRDILDPEGLSELLRQLQAQIILLQRRNRIKLVVSRSNAIRLNAFTGDWNLYKGEDRIPPASIDVVQFSNWLKRAEERNRKLVGYVQGLELPTFSLYYEDLLVNEQATLEQVCSFLDVEFEAIKGGCIKNTSDDLREAVVNFDELRSHYIGTPYEPMFDEVLLPI
jgi:LPS sulfotransferase NodH